MTTNSEDHGPPRPEDSLESSLEHSLDERERKYAREHALHKPLGTMQIWALGVGSVITGEYFGWNMGLSEGGPIGMLLATLFVCTLYMLWVLGLSELAVAMPFAGGPLAYGRRASGPLLGFAMGWSMFLETLFATIGTATATGGAIYFLISVLVDPVKWAHAWGWVAAEVDADAAAKTANITVTTACGLATVALFAGIQWYGAKFQARLMEWMTHGAILGLVWFWIAAAPGIDPKRVFDGAFHWLEGASWAGPIKAIPYAIWWLVIIEAVALAAEEAREPHKSIPRGLVFAQGTLIVLVLLTWFVVSAAGADYRETATVVYPLQGVYREIWPGSAHRWHLALFSLIALFGMVASYNGMLYAVSRQSFSLGRAGYLPRFLGHVHPIRRTPDASIGFWSLVIAGFVVWGYFDTQAVVYAVLTCNLTALLWYAMAMVCLIVLRRKEPNMPRPYRVPGYPWTPMAVIVMSLFAAGVYGWLQAPIVLWLTAGMYALGFVYFLLVARNRLEKAAPEEFTAPGR